MSVFISINKVQVLKNGNSPLSPIPPTLDDWIGIILEIFRMEELTYRLRTQQNKFYQIWNNWILFIAPMRADFI